MAHAPGDIAIKTRLAIKQEGTPGTAATFGATDFLTCEGPIQIAIIGQPDDTGGVVGTASGDLTPGADVVLAGKCYLEFRFTAKLRRPATDLDLFIDPLHAALRACRLASDAPTTTYSPTFITSVWDSSHVTIAAWRDNRYYRGVAGLGTVTLRGMSGNAILADFRIVALCVDTLADWCGDCSNLDNLDASHTWVTATPNPSANPSFKAKGAVTIEGTAHAVPAWALDMNNQIIVPEKCGSGFMGYDIPYFGNTVAQAPTLGLQFRNVAKSAFDPLARFLNDNDSEAGDAVVINGSAGAQTLAITAPKVMQVTHPNEVEVAGHMYWPMAYRVCNDAFTLTTG